jgi:hypothetical protein
MSYRPDSMDEEANDRVFADWDMLFKQLRGIS